MRATRSRLDRLIGEIESRARESARLAAEREEQQRAEQGRRVLGYVFANPELHTALVELDELARGDRPCTDPITTDELLAAGRSDAGRPHAEVIRRHADRLLAAAARGGEPA